MNLELNKSYITRNGDKVAIFGLNGDIFIGCRMPEEIITRYYPDGNCYYKNEGRDIIGEWIEPITTTITLYLYKVIDDGEVFTEYTILPDKYYELLGKKTITITEGDNI
jgi:hypothetical protein